MMKLVLPLLAPSQNDFSKYRDWKMRSIATQRIRGLWAATCRIQMNVYGVPRAITRRRLHVVAYRRQRCRDPGNLVGGLKPGIDGLVDVGLLLDDDRKRARITYAQDTLKASPLAGQPCTVLLIEDITSCPSLIDSLIASQHPDTGKE